MRATGSPGRWRGRLRSPVLARARTAGQVLGGEKEWEASGRAARLCFMSAFSVEDLFTAGVGFDFTGAFLIGRGLLQSPDRMIDRASTFFDLSLVDLARQVEDRIDAEAGFAALLSGLVLQLAGYSAVLAGRTVDTGGNLAVTGFTIGVLASIAAVVGWRLTRERRLRHRSLHVAIIAPREGALPLNSKVGAPRGDWLHRMGVEAGFPEIEDEGRTAYLARVFGVTDFYDPNDAYDP